MWYFAWILGLGFAVLLAVMNAMWGEFEQDRKESLAAAREDAGH
ncbi:MAG: cytochrome bd-I oxidase subunit CydX [Neisseria sp.]|nr:cytochrome bd-I oxidase subunit CydX [Neisseria sp.]